MVNKMEHQENAGEFDCKNNALFYMLIFHNTELSMSFYQD
jgi:hypothetical protein